MNFSTAIVWKASLGMFMMIYNLNLGVDTFRIFKNLDLYLLEIETNQNLPKRWLLNFDGNIRVSEKPSPTKRRENSIFLDS